MKRINNRNLIPPVLALVFSLLFMGCGGANPPADEAPKEDTVVTEDVPAGEDTAAADGQTAPPEESVTEDTLSAEEPPPEPEITGPESNIVGIITDATAESVTLQTPDGALYYFSIPQDGVNGNLSYMIIGQLATLTYRGSLDESHANLTGISGSSMETGVYLEEYAFAIRIINAVRDMDMESFSDLCNFPLFIDTGNYYGNMNTSGEFEAIDNEKIFTKELVDRIVNYNLFDLQYTGAGFAMGNGGPNITFDVDEDGILGIVGISSTATPR